MIIIATLCANLQANTDHGKGEKNFLRWKMPKIPQLLFFEENFQERIVGREK